MTSSFTASAQAAALPLGRPASAAVSSSAPQPAKVRAHPACWERRPRVQASSTGLDYAYCLRPGGGQGQGQGKPSPSASFQPWDSQVCRCALGQVFPGDSSTPSGSYLSSGPLGPSTSSRLASLTPASSLEVGPGGVCVWGVISGRSCLQLTPPTTLADPPGLLSPACLLQRGLCLLDLDVRPAGAGPPPPFFPSFPFLIDSQILQLC